MKAVVFPGQGSQFKGMGRRLFVRYPDAVRQAELLLGYSLTELCLEDPRRELDQTEFTQPAVYVTAYLAYRQAFENGLVADVLAGHSVGEYVALAAANAVDFETGLTIVRERARLMGKIVGGGLAAIINQSRDAVDALIDASGLQGLEIANVNSPMQVVIGGPRDKLRQMISFCCGLKIRAMPLRVSGPFHTSLMKPASEAFRHFLGDIEFHRPETNVIANLTAEPHRLACMADVLADHIASPVLWTQTVERMLDDGVTDFVEIGERPVLTALITDIRERHANRPHPLRMAGRPTPMGSRPASDHAAPTRTDGFCNAFGCERPLVACGLGNGASGPALVEALTRGGTLAFLDTDDVDGETLERSLGALSRNDRTRSRFGVSITYEPDRPERAIDVISMLQRHGVRHCELRGFDEPPPFIAAFRRNTTSFTVDAPCRIIARVTNVMAAESFLRPPGESSNGDHVVDALCVDMIGWRAREAPASSLLYDVLARRDAALGSTRMFVGVGGVGGRPEAVQGLLETGVDFVAAGSLLLTSREAALSEATRASLCKASHDDVRLTADWAYPELGSRSWIFATETGLAIRMDELHAWYRAPDPSRHALIQILDDARDLPAGLRAIRALAEDQHLTIRDLRRALRLAASEAHRSPAFLECDESLALWNAWRNESAHAREDELSASRIATLLHP